MNFQGKEKGMVAFLPRILYVIVVISLYLLVWPNPVTIFLAACFSCLTIPLYRKLRKMADIWRRKLLINGAQTRLNRFLLTTARIFPIFTYTAVILCTFLLPFAVIALLVSPQAVAGLARLRELKATNFQLPLHWVQYLQELRKAIHEFPAFEKALNDTINNLDSMLTDAVGMLVSRSFGFVGSTMNILWLTFLFLMLTILFTQYSKSIRIVFSRILRLPYSLLSRFTLAIHKALKGVMLGIVLVALVQGTLCGIGFAVAGVNQPAFWGMLATMVAPIPAIGTALVWGPLCISLWFTGKTMAAVGLALWGALFISSVDNLLRPFFLRQGIKAPFFVLIIVILCGLSSFGAVGLIAGPVLLAISLQAFEEAKHYHGKTF